MQEHNRSTVAAGFSPWSGMAQLPLGTFCALIIVVYVLPSEPVLGGMGFIPWLNMVATPLGASVVAILAAVGHLSGSDGVTLPLGSGMLGYAVTGFMANLVLHTGNVNATFSITCLGYNIAGLFSLVAALKLIGFSRHPASARRVLSLVCNYAAVLLLSGAIFWVSFSGLLPPFFIGGAGSTTVRYAAQSVAAAELGFASITLWIIGHRGGSAFLRWYSLGLAMLALAMVGAFSYTRLDSLDAWVVRGCFYAGSAYLVVAMVITVRQSGRMAIPLAALRETYDRYMRLLENSPDAILVHQGGRYVLANPAAAALFGAGDPEELIDRQVMDLVHPDSRPMTGNGIGYRSPPGQSTPLDEIVLLRLDGKPLHTERIATAVEYNGRPAVQVTIRDLSARKQAQERIEVLARFPSENPNPVLRAERGGRLAYANQASQPLLDAWGTGVGEDLPGGLARMVDQRLDQGSAQEIDIRCGDRVFLFTFAPVAEAGYVNLYGRDITAIRQAERSLQELNATLEQRVAERTAEAERRTRQLQALAAQLIAAEESERKRIGTVLHDDLQQVLASCKMRLPALQPHLDGTAQGRQVLTQMGGLLDESLAACRLLTLDLSPPALEHGGLLPALEALAKRMGDRHGLAVELGSGTPRVDRQFQATLGLFVYRAVQELLFNVVKHSGVSKANVSLDFRENCLEVVIADSGRGFDPAAIRLAAGAQSGFGLLSIEERARSLGGSLNVDSAPGRGSRLTLAVPFSPAVPAPPVEAADSRAANAGSRTREATGPTVCRVLLVDDHKVMREGLVAALYGKPGVQVVGQAADGEEALERVRELAPDVVLLDIRMPRMDGYEATRRIKAGWPEVRVIGLSMYAEQEASQAMREAGAEQLLSKADSIEAILEAIYGPPGED